MKSVVAALLVIIGLMGAAYLHLAKDQDHAAFDTLTEQAETQDYEAEVRLRKQLQVENRELRSALAVRDTLRRLIKCP